MQESPPTTPTVTKSKEGRELSLVIYPNKFLRFKTHPFNEEMLKTALPTEVANAMVKKMYELNGVGLAATQVGVPNSIFVMDHQWQVNGEKKPQIFLNPKILELDESKGIEIAPPGEGCLSLPYGFRRPIPRPHRVHLEWTDLAGYVQRQWFDHTAAIVIQHEMDHLEGHIFPDRLSRLQQDMFIRRVKKIRRRYKKSMKASKKAYKQWQAHQTQTADDVMMKAKEEQAKKEQGE